MFYVFATGGGIVTNTSTISMFVYVGKIFILWVGDYLDTWDGRKGGIS